jgi:hypothetical protein
MVCKPFVMFSNIFGDFAKFQLKNISTDLHWFRSIERSIELLLKLALELKS